MFRAHGTIHYQNRRSMSNLNVRRTVSPPLKSERLRVRQTELPKTLCVTVDGISEKSAVAIGTIEPLAMSNTTVDCDHDAVDGAANANAGA